MVGYVSMVFLYYPASTNSYSKISMIVCFDVRFENFRFIEHRSGTLINFNGKLGAIMTQMGNFVCEATTSLKLCILEDAEKGESSEHTYVLSASCKSVFEDKVLEFVGVTRSNELVLSSCLAVSKQTELYYIYYYNLERNTVVEIGIQGMEAFGGNRVYTCVDHVENVKLTQRSYNLRSCRRTRL
ncbi:unnamed protein product [Cochlearia groenlandica]